MGVVTAEEIRRYLDENFVTLDDLAARAGAEPGRIAELLAAQCIPPHSHELREVAVFTSTFGEYAAPAAVRRYYHPSLVKWARMACTLAETHGLAEVARLVREDFEREFAEALDGREPPWPRGADHAWAYLMDGTWGLCLKEISARSLLEKEFARAKIAKINGIPGPGPGHAADDAACAALEAAIAQYNAVAALFAPHEIGKSSRRLEVEAAARTFGLAPE
jgi:hypothetical protein